MPHSREDEESDMFGTLFAAGSLMAFGWMLGKAVEVKNQGYYPPKPPRKKVVVPDEPPVKARAPNETVIPANEDLMASLQQAAENSRGDRERPDVIDADDIET